MSLTLFAIGKIFTFNTKAPAILGSTISNAKLVGTMDYSIAITYDNIDLKYRTIYPLLPIGTVDQPEGCVYYQFLTESGERIILADQWIEEASIEVIEHINFQVLFSRASVPDMSRVRDSLLSLGYTDFDIKQL